MNNDTDMKVNKKEYKQAMKDLYWVMNYFENRIIADNLEMCVYDIYDEMVDIVERLEKAKVKK